MRTVCVGVIEKHLAIAHNFTLMTADEINALRKRCHAQASGGPGKLFKTILFYDGGVGRERYRVLPAKEVPL